MADLNKYAALRKLIPFFEKELPVTAQIASKEIPAAEQALARATSNLPARRILTPEVEGVGKRTTQYTPPLQDAEIVQPKQIESKSTALTDNSARDQFPIVEQAPETQVTSSAEDTYPVHEMGPGDESFPIIKDSPESQAVQATEEATKKASTTPVDNNVVEQAPENVGTNTAVSDESALNALQNTEDSSNTNGPNYKKLAALSGIGGAAAGGAAYLANRNNKQTPPGDNVLRPEGSVITPSENDDEALDKMRAQWIQENTDKQASGKNVRSKATDTSSTQDGGDESTDKSPSTNQTSALQAPTNIASLERFQQLQNQANDESRWQRMAQAFSQMRAGMMGQKEDPFSNIYKENIVAAQQVPNQYIQQVEFQKLDPDSAVSQQYRKMGEYLGIPVNPQTSAMDLEKAFPQMVNIKTREDMIAARKDMAAERADNQNFRNQLLQQQIQDKAVQRQADQENKQNILDSRRLDTWAKTMSIPSNRSVLGQAQQQMYAVDRIQGLLQGHPLGNVTPQEMQEVVAGLDRVISGTSTQHGRQTLDPATLRSKFAALMQQVTNAPQGAQGQAFLSRIQGNLMRERNIARQQALSTVKGLLAGSGDFARRQSVAEKNGGVDQFKEFLTNAGLPPDLYEQPTEQYGSPKVSGPINQPAIQRQQTQPVQQTQQPVQQTQQPVQQAPLFGIPESDIDRELAARAAKKGVQ